MTVSVPYVSDPYDWGGVLSNDVQFLLKLLLKINDFYSKQVKCSNLNVLKVSTPMSKELQKCQQKTYFPIEIREKYDFQDPFKRLDSVWFLTLMAHGIYLKLFFWFV